VFDEKRVKGPNSGGGAYFGRKKKGKENKEKRVA